KDPSAQPAKTTAPSPGLTPEQAKVLARRGRKPACHSDHVGDADRAKRLRQDHAGAKATKE
ncbi:MAG: hypothetical protein ACPMAQ_19195, partial [Phycisphaerae bacterium]